MFRQNAAFSTPPVVKNLIIINALFFLAQSVLPNGWGNLMTNMLGLHYWASADFRLYQLISYMFLHGNTTHLFFNMYALWMFGRMLEYNLGSKRFLIYYMITGIGAGLIQMGVCTLEMLSLESAIAQGGNTPSAMASLYALINGLTIGASGAVYGVLLAFGMMHPNNIIMMLIPPMPIKAKYFVIFYGVLELFLGIASTGSQIAHFAHVGGMIFGFFLLRWWKKSGKIYF
ncbi:MAG: rhomboid family intramembrane serine protease [Rikenellaceae bacterium]